MANHICLLACLITLAHLLPPDKVSGYHIVKIRSIDINNAHSLTTETRLEKVVEPTGYRLQFEPYLEDGIFKGHVKINVTWLQNADEINVHCAHDLEIVETKVFIESKSGTMEKITVSKVVMDAKKPIATLYLEKILPNSTKGYLNFEIKGNMQTDRTEAFFETTYKEQDVERIVAATQLRPNNARRMFPCFDEPGYKTPFELSVVRPRNMVALSNVPVARTEEIADEPNAVWDHFERTPPMSTFTFGLVIAELQLVANTTIDNIELRVWGRPEFHEALQGVSNKFVQVYREIANFWRVPLPLRRLDIVALPNYKGVKPADNWGLIVFKFVLRLPLIDLNSVPSPLVSAHLGCSAHTGVDLAHLSNTHSMFILACHRLQVDQWESDLSSRGYLQLAQELSYQWLGAFTTPSWWSDEHLNKALVGYLAADVTFKINDGSEMEGKWPMTVLYSLYYEFSKRYPHSRITGMKQETACTKIELLFRMFNYTLGADTFKKGLRTFMESRKFKTFTGDDIWSALNTVARAEGKIPKDFNVKTAVDSWIEENRLPLITAQRNYESNSVTVTQKLYLRERPHDVPDAGRMTWWAPLVVARGDKLDFTNTAPVAWMQNQKSLDIPNMPNKENFIIVNPEEIAPYPVNYDENNWYLLSNFLQSDSRTLIPELTRAKLLHDAWNLAYAGELSFATAFNMTLFLKNERHHIVWDPFFTMIDHLSRHICLCNHEKFQQYVSFFLVPLYKELIRDEKEDEENWRKNLRSLTKTFLCKANYEFCIDEAVQQYSKWMQAQSPDDGNPISNTYICPVFEWGSRDEWEFGLQRVINFPHSRKQSERTFLLKALAGCPTDEYKINRLLNITILEGNGNFTETDIFLIFSMLTSRQQGYTTLYYFLRDNWDVLKEKFSRKANIWNSLITSATSQFSTKEGLELVSNLYVAHQGEFGSAEHIIEKSIRNIREEAKWSADNLPVVNKWLDDFVKNYAS